MASGTVKYFYPSGTGEYIDVGDAGDSETGLTNNPAVAKYMEFMSNPAVRIANMVVSGALAYHGYKRHKGSILWAIVWGVFVPNVIGLPIALAEGFGKPQKGK